MIVGGGNSIKLYLETTMFNYYFDTERDGHADTVRLFETFIYVAKGIIPVKFRLDGVQIAIAAIHGLDYVLSYNYQHINRARTKLLTDRVNNAKGYSSVLICTAKEVLEDEQGSD